MQTETDGTGDGNKKIEIPDTLTNQKDQNNQKLIHRHMRSASEARMEYTLYGPLMRADFAGILERKNSLPRNFRLRISTDPDEFASKAGSKKDS